MLIGLVFVAPDSYAERKSWQEIGKGSASGVGISDTHGFSERPSLAMDSAGNPVVAWADNTPTNYEIYVRRWNGMKWVGVSDESAWAGGISNNPYRSGDCSMVLDRLDRPVIAWYDNSFRLLYEIYIRRWDGENWVEIGDHSATGGGITNNMGKSGIPVLALDDKDNPIVAFPDGSSGDFSEIYVKRWDGENWVEMGEGSASGGGISNNPGGSGNPSIAVDKSGKPVIAWQDFSSGTFEIYIKRWDGTSWVEVGLDSSRKGGISNTTGFSEFPSLALDSKGKPVVAWRDDSSGNDEIYIRRWNGKKWVETGKHSASGGGISNDSAASHGPSLVIDSMDNPVVAWWSREGESSDIYVRRWNGKKWVEAGKGSASERGVSNTVHSSWFPRLAIDKNDNLVVVWQDVSGGNTVGGNFEIYIKKYAP